LRRLISRAKDGMRAWPFQLALAERFRIIGESPKLDRSAEF
jgi:hypothetical protein